MHFPVFLLQIPILNKFLLTTLLLLLRFHSGAQYSGVLTGVMEMSTGEKFPYRLAFTEADGKLQGFSYTYEEPRDTKSIITGEVDKKNRTISFRETSIVYSGGYHSRAYMCLVDARLDYLQDGKGNVLNGPLTTREADKTLCTGGFITFRNDSEIQNLFSYHDSFDTVITMRTKIHSRQAATVAMATSAELAEHARVTITAGQVKTYDWNSDSVMLELWDGGNVDGDRVTVRYNGQNYLSNYCLQKERKIIKLPVSVHQTDTLAIVAENEGTDPPNTADVRLTDGAIHYNILAYNKKGDQALIRIRKSKGTTARTGK